MKYDFDSIIDRAHAPYSYSAKWMDEGVMAEMMRKMIGLDSLPDDRLCFQTADMDFKCAPELVEAMKKTAEHGIFGYSIIPDAYYAAVCRWFHDRFDWDFSPKSITEAEILKIGEICRRNGVIIVSDEVHIDIARKGQKVLPIMKVLGPQGVISATAVNKTFNVAGLGMSNLIIEDPYLMARFKKGFPMSNPFGVSAVIAAYTKCDEWVDELNEYLDKLIDYTMDRFAKDLPKVEVVKPEGTYVLWLDFCGYGLSDEELAKKINATHLVLQDGKFFDETRAGQYRRICLTSPMSQVVEMCDRLAAAFKDC